VTGTDLVLLDRADDAGPPSGPGRSAPARGPAGLLARLRAEWSPVDSLAAAMTGLHLAAVLVLVVPGSLYLDDLRAQGYAQGRPFWSFVVGSNGTHFAPLPRVLDWLQVNLAPLQHGPAVIVTLGVRLVLAVAFWRLLRRLFGPRPVTLVPFLVLLATPVLLIPTAWYRQSITILACTAAMVWALDAHLRLHLHRRRADLATVGVATAVALGCLEKGALLPGILLAASVLLVGAGRPRVWWREVRAGLPGVLLSAVLVGAFLLVYRSGPYDRPETGAASPADLVELAWRTVARSLAPGLLGIGWQLQYPSPYAGIPFVGGGWLVVTGVLAAALLLPALLRHPARVLRALLFGLAWVAGSVVVVAVGRFASVGMLLADSQRVWADLVPALLLTVALAVLPWRFGAGVDDGRAAADSVRRNGWRARAVPVLVLAGTLGTVAGSALSWQRFADGWWDNPTGRWIANARSSLAAAPAAPRVVPRPLPEQVMPSWVQTTFPDDRPLVALLRPDARFGDGDGRLLALSRSGRLQPFIPVVLATAPAGRGGCLATITGDAEVPVRFPAPVLHRPGAVVEIGLLVDRTTTPVIRLVRPDRSQPDAQRWNRNPLAAGPHTVLVPFPAGEFVSGVRIAAPGVGRACVVGVRVWVPYS
jgi:hypothetical protein